MATSSKLEINPAAALKSFARAQVRCVGSAKFLDVPNHISSAWWRAGPEASLLVRDCYSPMFDRVWNQNGAARYSPRVLDYTTGSVVLGNPGIGKTGFLFWSLWRLLKQRQKVVIKLRTNDMYVCISEYFDGEPVVTEHERFPGKFRPGVRPWYLADSTIDEGDWGLPCKFLLTCSPLKANFHGFSKGSGISLLYDPVWTLQELLALNDENFKYPREDVERRFRLWGGIPYYVLHNVDDQSNQMELDKAVNRVRDPDDITQLHVVPLYRPEDQGVFNGFHIKVDENYSFQSLSLASSYVAEKLFAKLPLRELKRFVTTEQGSHVQGIQETLFEMFMLQKMLPRGVRMIFRNLQKNGLLGPEEEICLPGLKVTRDLESNGAEQDVVFPTLPLVAGDDMSIFKPKMGTNGEWNFLAHGSVFRVTTTQTHALKLGKGTKAALKFLRSFQGSEKRKIDFCILVPDEYVGLNRFQFNWSETKMLMKDNGDGKGSEKDFSAVVQDVMHILDSLNVRVRVCCVRIGHVCPTCTGTGVSQI